MQVGIRGMSCAGLPAGRPACQSAEPRQQRVPPVSPTGQVVALNSSCDRIEGRISDGATSQSEARRGGSGTRNGVRSRVRPAEEGRAPERSYAT